MIRHSTEIARRTLASAAATAAIGACLAAQAGPVTFEATATARRDCRDGIARVEMDLVQMREYLFAEVPSGQWEARVEDLETGQEVLSQTDLELEDTGNAVWGTVHWLIAGEQPDGASRRYRVTLGFPRQARAAQGLSVERSEREIVVRTPQFAAHHPLSAGGLLADVSYAGEAGRTLPLNMNDRLWDQQRGGFALTTDRTAQVEVLTEGPLTAVIRTTARYCDAEGRPAPGEPQATYSFAYSAFSPSVKMTARVSQQGGPSWSQLHVFEMRHRTPFFTQLAMSPPLESQQLVDERTTHPLRGKHWGAVFNEQDALALICSDLYGIHTNVTGHGVYVHGPWQSFEGGEREFEATLYLGPSGGSAARLAEAVEGLRGRWETRVRLADMMDLGAHEPAAVREQIEGILPFASRAGPQQAAAARRLGAAGKWLADAAERAGQKLVRLDEWDRLANMAAWVGGLALGTVTARDAPVPSPLAYADEGTVVLVGDGIGLRFTRTADSMGLAQLGHTEAQADFLAPGAEGELWRLILRDTESGELVTVGPRQAASRSWETREEGETASLEMSWGRCSVGEAAEALDVTVSVTASNDSNLTRWRLRLRNRSERYGLWESHFPRLAPVGPGGQVCVPLKWGTVYELPLTGSGYRAWYPSGGAFGQVVSYWRDGSGLYLGAHDGSAGVKELSVVADGEDCIRYELNTLPPDMGVPKPERDLGYDFVLGAYEGDWFEAAKIYRDWAMQQFWCRKGPIVEREDMPRWWKDCALCFRPTGDPETVRAMLERLAAGFEMPAVVHWYAWHQIPFDNDYPEYFPVKPGFGAAVAGLQKLGLHIMPYINGHLWDTDTKSWQEENGRSAAALDVEGQPYIETWSEQKHAAMCPHTELWRRKMREVVVRLVQEYGCKGVYLDQIGAARPRPCFNPQHGHPLGGGDSWARGYDELLAEVRRAAQAIDPEFIMTTESHAEPYMAQLDGHLMCNLVGANQVPLYAAIYGGYTQTFGRQGEVANPTAFRMEHGQAFAFGSMMGRVNSEELLKPENAELLEYLKSLAQMRYDYRDFMAFGEMLRPPEIEGEIPTVATQWLSKTRDYVEMDAIQRSAWRAQDGRVGLFFTNVADEAVSFACEFRTEDFDIRPHEGQTVQVEMRTTLEEGAVPELLAAPGLPFTVTHTFQPMETMAVVMSVG